MTLVLLAGQIVHGLVYADGAGRRFADVLPPELGHFRIIRNIGAGRCPGDTGRAAVEFHQTAEFRCALGKGLVPDIAVTNEGQADVGLFQRRGLGTRRIAHRARRPCGVPTGVLLKNVQEPQS